MKKYFTRKPKVTVEWFVRSPEEVVVSCHNSVKPEHIRAIHKLSLVYRVFKESPNLIKVCFVHSNFGDLEVGSIVSVLGGNTEQISRTSTGQGIRWVTFKLVCA